MCAVAEAIQYFVGDDKEYSHIEILSIPCIPKPSGWITEKRKKRSFVGWKDSLFQTSMDGQSYFADYFLDKTLNLIAPNSVYKRIKAPTLSPEQMRVIDMDRADKQAIKTIKSLGSQDGYTLANKPEIIRFFKTNKTYQV